jgi:hypothetical protein
VTQKQRNNNKHAGYGFNRIINCHNNFLDERTKVAALAKRECDERYITEKNYMTTKTPKDDRNMEIFQEQLKKLLILLTTD